MSDSEDDYEDGDFVGNLNIDVSTHKRSLKPSTVSAGLTLPSVGGQPPSLAVPGANANKPPALVVPGANGSPSGSSESLDPEEEGEYEFEKTIESDISEEKAVELLKNAQKTNILLRMFNDTDLQALASVRSPHDQNNTAQHSLSHHI